MARDKGTSKFPATYEVHATLPLDPRLTVDTYNELKLADTWPNTFNDVYSNATATKKTEIDNYISANGREAAVKQYSIVFTYIGMIVAVTADTTSTKNGVYLLTNSNYTLDSSWKKISDSISSITGTFSGTNKNTAGPSATISVANSLHTHSGTASATSSTAFAVAHPSHKHTVTNTGTVTSTFTGSPVNSSSSGLIATYDSETLELSITTGHTHPVTAGGSVTSTFTGNSLTTSAPDSTTNVAPYEHTHSVSVGATSSTGISPVANALHTHSYTPEGSISIVTTQN